MCSGTSTCKTGDDVMTSKWLLLGRESRSGWICKEGGVESLGSSDADDVG